LSKTTVDLTQLQYAKKIAKGSMSPNWNFQKGGGEGQTKISYMKGMHISRNKHKANINNTLPRAAASAIAFCW